MEFGNLPENKIYDCIIIGAGPGGLQAALCLCRYNRNVLILDRGGGRTWHAKHIENLLTQSAISGRKIIEKGLSQVMHFGAEYQKATSSKIIKNKENLFEICYGSRVRIIPDRLFIVGPLNTGNDQVVIAAGEGAVAAIDINKRLLEIHAG